MVCSDRIWIRTDAGETLSRPLEAFPTLKDASETQRKAFKIGRFGDAIRWEEIDEDIHVSSFYDKEEPDYDNEIARIFRRFPQLNVSEVARSMGIHKSLLSKYILWNKTAERTTERADYPIAASVGAGAVGCLITSYYKAHHEGHLLFGKCPFLMFTSAISECFLSNQPLTKC